MLLRLPFFFFNDTATPEISPLSLHAALPISPHQLPGLLTQGLALERIRQAARGQPDLRDAAEHERSSRSLQDRKDRKSTRLNSSHLVISYAVFCLKKKITCLPTITT